MTRFILLYVGPPTPPDASHEGWPAWFQKVGDRLADRGSPLKDGFALHGDGSTNPPATRVNGYSIVVVDDKEEVLGLMREHPYLSQGPEYSIEAHVLP
jgi:hypothetical protein